MELMVGFARHFSFRKTKDRLWHLTRAVIDCTERAGYNKTPIRRSAFFIDKWRRRRDWVNCVQVLRTRAERAPSSLRYVEHPYGFSSRETWIQKKRRFIDRRLFRQMAEKEGFEPPVELPPQLISSQSHSTTLALLRHKTNPRQTAHSEFNKD